MMAIVDDKTLRVQGKVDYSLLEKFLHQSVTSNDHSDWFFIDYSPSDFPLKTKFDLLFSSRHIPQPVSVLIDKVYDSFGHYLKAGIPKGFKTVCQLSFAAQIPIAFQQLPTLKGWKSSPDDVLLTSLENMEFNNFPELVEDLITMIKFDLQENYYLKADKITKKEFLSRLADIGLKDSERLLTFLTQQGLIKQENEEDLVLNA